MLLRRSPQITALEIFVVGICTALLALLSGKCFYCACSAFISVKFDLLLSQTLPYLIGGAVTRVL